VVVEGVTWFMARNGNPINRALTLAVKPTGLILIALGVVAAVMSKDLYLKVAKAINPKILEVS